MKKLFVFTSFILLTLSSVTKAEIRINGFANLVAGYSDTDTELFGYTDDIDFSNESLFALQLSGDITDKLSATGQILSRGSDDFNAKFEWAYLSYAASDNISISAGRIRLPLFLYSESLDVGYSYHWITPPNSVYAIAFNNMDGVKVTYNGYGAGWDYVLTAAYGVITNPSVPVGDGLFASLKGENTLLLSAEMVKDSFKARFNYGRADGTLELAAVDQILASFAPLAPELADLLAFNDDEGLFYGLSLSYDNFDWFISGEYTLNTNEDTFTPDDIAYYVTGGIRLGKFTPSLTYQKRDGEDDLKFLEELSALAQPIQQAIAPAVLGIQLNQMENWDAWTFGLRYDFSTRIALKGEYVSNGDDINDTNDANLFRLAVNYVF
ncbi:porin [Glaciecola siphonariae]|uniref:Porin n=1 Tax=Glaciecola siphonariae TaxID=521012 RepID=A0ABV9LUM7_9ALTE